MVKVEPEIKEKLDELDKRVNDILTNEIPHIIERIQELENQKMELRPFYIPSILGVIIGLASLFYGVFQNTLFYTVGGAIIILIVLLKLLEENIRWQKS